jgi:predicted anti-sigma-YlaC factor YlaD
MITCREVISFLLEYLDGSLTPEERVRFERHLSVCESCTAYLKTYEATIRMERLTALDEAAIPEDLVKAVMASRNP